MVIIFGLVAVYLTQLARIYRRIRNDGSLVSYGHFILVSWACTFMFVITFLLGDKCCVFVGDPTYIIILLYVVWNN